MITAEEGKATVEEQIDSTNNISTLKKTLLLGLTPLVIAVLLYISLNICIQVSRCYSHWRLKKQLQIIGSSQQCLVVSNPSIDDSDQQTFPQVV